MINENVEWVENDNVEAIAKLMAKARGRGAEECAGYSCAWEEYEGSGVGQKGLRDCIRWLILG